MPLLTSDRLRLRVDINEKTGALDALRGQTPIVWRSSDVSFELGLFYNGQLIDPSNLASVTVVIKAAGPGNVAPDAAAAPLASKTVLAAALTEPSQEEWADGTGQHAVATFSGTEMNFALGGRQYQWLIVTLLTTEGAVMTAAAGLIEVREDGYDSAGTAPVVDGTAFTKAETLALLAGGLPPEIDVRLSVLGGLPVELSAAELVEHELAIDTEARQIVVGDGAGSWYAPLMTGPEVMATMGEELIGALATMRGMSSGIFYIATSRVGAVTLSVRTDTGYARWIYADNTLGPQAGGGVPAIPVSMTSVAGHGLRPLGVMSVASGGSVPSGGISLFACAGQRIHAVAWAGPLPGAWPYGLHIILSGNQLVRLPLWDVGPVQYLIVNVAQNHLTTIPAWDTSALTRVSIWAPNNRLRSLPLWDFSAVTDALALLFNGNPLRSLPLWDFSAAITITVHADDTGLTSLPVWQFSSLADVLDLNFSGCFIATIPDWDLSALSVSEANVVNLAQNLLPASEVDRAFGVWQLPALGAPDSTIDLSGNAAPTAASAAIRAALIGYGWTLTLDS